MASQLPSALRGKVFPDCQLSVANGRTRMSQPCRTSNQTALSVLVAAFALAGGLLTDAAQAAPHTVRSDVEHPFDPDWPDVVLEIEPTPPRGGKVVWQWRSWDHVIQDHDETKAAYGDVPAHHLSR